MRGYSKANVLYLIAGGMVAFAIGAQIFVDRGDGVNIGAGLVGLLSIPVFKAASTARRAAPHNPQPKQD